MKADQVNMADLGEWILSDPLPYTEDFAVHYTSGNDRYFGPGPIQTIPDILCKSMAVLLAADELLRSRTTRWVALWAPLTSVSEFPAEVPSSRLEIETLLGKSLPSLVLSDDTKTFIKVDDNVLTVVKLDSENILEGCGCDDQNVQISYFVKFELVPWMPLGEFQPSLLITIR